MKKRAFAALALALLFAVTGCKLVEKDLSVDSNTVVGELLGKQITKSEAQAVLNMQLSYNAYIYSMFGVPYSPTADDITQLKQGSVNTLAQRIANEDQLAKQGLNFTQEELDKIQSDTDTEYEDAVASYVTSAKAADASLSDEAAREQAINQLNSQGYTKDYFDGETRNAAVTAKLRENAIKDVIVSDDEVAAEYNRLVDEQKKTYTESPAQFGTDLNGSTVYYRPEGYRYVKNLLVGLPDDIQSQITELNSTISSNSTQRSSLQSQLDSAGDSEDAKELINNMIAELDTSDATANARIAELRAEAKEQIKSRADTLLALAKAPGADFDALIAQFGTDSGMKADPAKTNGYPIAEATTTYVQPFHDAALALAKPGDVSDLVETDYGYHIIQYASDIPSGETPFAEVRDDIQSGLLATKQDEAFTAKQAEWLAATGMKTYLNRWTD